jgi:hypothetical protein
LVHVIALYVQNNFNVTEQVGNADLRSLRSKLREFHVGHGVQARGAIPSTCVFTSTTAGLPAANA